MLTVEKAHLLLTREDGCSESPSHHRVALAAAALADHRVRIPIHGRAESLNLASAATLCLYASAMASPTCTR